MFHVKTLRDKGQGKALHLNTHFLETIILKIVIFFYAQKTVMCRYNKVG
jgi:hypothetical protein